MPQHGLGGGGMSSHNGNKTESILPEEKPEIKSSLTNNKFFWRLTALGGSHSIDEKIAQPQD
jgi:hypothetical protein